MEPNRKKTISLYDATVASFLRQLEAVSGFLDKARAHCESGGIDLGEVVETRLYPDMLRMKGAPIGKVDFLGKLHTKGG